MFLIIRCLITRLFIIKIHVKSSQNILQTCYTHIPAHRYTHILYLPQQYHAVITILVIFICKCKCLCDLQSVHINDLLYLRGIFVNPVFSFTQLDHALGCSVGVKIFWFDAAFNMNQSRLLRAS